jgi:putative integral membrane protein (TIGR02587 family)
MTTTAAEQTAKRSNNRHFMVGLARAFGGAVIFSFPILMTMEMWELGFHLDRLRFALFMILAVPMLIGLSFYDGFEDTYSYKDDVIDAFVAYAVGFVASATILLLFNVVNFNLSADEFIGKISLQAVTSAFGAMFAQSLLGKNNRSDENSDYQKRRVKYHGQIFLMIFGAVFLSMSLAATEEMILISFKMSDWHTVGLASATILMMHAFVYAVEFRGQEKAAPEGSSQWSVFLRYTIVGYAIVLLISFYLLWTFGRTDGLGIEEMIKAVIVLGFPAAIGASASRLIL